MKFRFSIGSKIGLGFGVLIFMTILAFILTQITLTKSRKVDEQIRTVITPSVSALEELNLLMVRSKTLISDWVHVQTRDDNPDKTKLKGLIDEEYPALKQQIRQLSANWHPGEKNTIDTIFGHIETLFLMHKDIMGQLNSFESYEDATIIFVVKSMVEDGDVDTKTKEILADLLTLIEVHHDNANLASNEMLTSFDYLQFVIKGLGFVLLIGGILIAAFTVRSIVKPVTELKARLLMMGRGVLPKEKMRERNDEIGEMSGALNLLVDTQEKTTQFAYEVGAGNFTSFYEPLSEEDNFGLALLKMRSDLNVNEQSLQNKVKERTEEVVRQKEEIEKQREVLERTKSKFNSSSALTEGVMTVLICSSTFRLLVKVTWVSIKARMVIKINTPKPTPILRPIEKRNFIGK